MPVAPALFEKPDPVRAIAPGNALAICLGVDPAWSVDNQGLCALVLYRFGNELVRVAHSFAFPGAGSSSLSLAQEAVKLVNEVRQLSGTPWLPVHVAFDATKDRTLAQSLIEFGVAVPQRGAVVPGVRLPTLQGVIFGGAGTQQSPAQPIFIVLPGRGRFTVPTWHVPKTALYVSVRQLLVHQLLKIAPGDGAAHLVRELGNLQGKITAARRVTVQPGDETIGDDRADALALACWLSSEFEQERSRALLRQGRGRQLGPSSAAGWT
jgi:hypothetical protein